MGATQQNDYLLSWLIGIGHGLVVSDTPVREGWAYAGSHAAFEAGSRCRHEVLSPVTELIVAAWAGLFADKSVRNHLSRA